MLSDRNPTTAMAQRAAGLHPNTPGRPMRPAQRTLRLSSGSSHVSVGLTGLLNPT